MSKCVNDKSTKSGVRGHEAADEDENNDDHSPVQYIKNPYIDEKTDVLFHLTLSNRTHDLKAMFHDVKFVCLGGTVERMKSFAEYLEKELRLRPEGGGIHDLTGKGHRYSMFKVGSVLCVNHGMGFPSMMILMNELIKLMQYAGVRDPIFIRTGTSGGFNVPGGTVVIANEVLSDFLEPLLEVPILGKIYRWPCVLDEKIAQDLKSIADEKYENMPVLLGRAISQLHFYEGTAMKTGAICEQSDEDRERFFDRLKTCEVLCADMESLVLGAITHKVGIRAAFVSVVVNDAFSEGQHVPTPDEWLEWQKRPGLIVAQYIKRYCGSL